MPNSQRGSVVSSVFQVVLHPPPHLFQGLGGEFHEVVDRRLPACLQSAPLELRMRVLEVERVDLRRAALADRGGELSEQDARH